jgi:hypothetical protein
MIERKEYSFYIGKNNNPNLTEQKNYPHEDYPIAMTLYLGNNDDLNQLKACLSKLPKEKVKYRQYQGYCKKGVDIYLACVDSVKQILFDTESPVSGASLIIRSSTDKQIFPYQVLEQARQIVSEPEINLNKPQSRGR